MPTGQHPTKCSEHKLRGTKFATLTTRALGWAKGNRMSYMKGIEPAEAGWFTRLIYGFVRRKFARLTGKDRLIEQVQVSAHHPRLFRSVELTSAIACENFRARFNRGFGIEAERFTDGAACPVHFAVGTSGAHHGTPLPAH